MRSITILLVTCSLLILFNIDAKSQADTLLSFCSKHLPSPYLSDGQQYKALLNGDETAEYHATFYGGTTYRIVACCGVNDGNLIFTLFDKDRHELFSNKSYKNAPYWDFKFKSTIDCIIEAQLDPQGPASGFAIILIGFKQK
jgi:hypothetical protein